MLQRARSILSNLSLLTTPSKAKDKPVKSPFIWPVNYAGIVQWQMGNFLNYASDGYALNAVIYAAISYKIRAITQAKARAYMGDPSNPELLPPTHPLSRLAIRPNPYMSWIEMQGLLECYLNIAGNAYLYIDRRNSRDGTPTALWPIRPDEMFIIPGEGDLKGYMYLPKSGALYEGGVPILIEDMIHVKFPNPMDPYEGLGYGLSPMSPLAQSADVDNSVTRFLKLFFDRGAMPAGLLKYDIPLDKEMVGEIKARWRQIYGGVDNWTDIGILDSGAEYQKLSQSFKDMGFTDIDERNESRIVGPFGVPAMLIGTRGGLDSATYSNMEEARRAFWEDTMMYEIRLFETEMQYHLLAGDGAYIMYDVSTVPALRQNMGPLVDTASKLWDMGVPANMALSAVGLKLPPIPDGDKSYISTRVLPSGESADTPNHPSPTGDKGGLPQLIEHTLDEHQDAELKAKVADRMVEIAESWEPQFRKLAAQCFQRDLEELLGLFGKEHHEAIEIKGSIKWQKVYQNFEQWMKHNGKENWMNTFAPAISGVVIDTGTSWNTSIGIAFNIRNLMAEQWFQEYKLKFADEVSDTTLQSVHGIIADALAEGWSNQELMGTMTDVFNTWAGAPYLGEDSRGWFAKHSPPNRAEMIARTETNRSANAGSQALYKDWDVKKKEWSTSIDGRERETHRKVDGQVRLIDTFFLVGGFKMKFPGDQSQGAPAREVINCRCSLLPADVNQIKVTPLQTPAAVVNKEPPATVKQIAAINTANKEGKYRTATDKEMQDEYREYFKTLSLKQRNAIKKYTGNEYFTWNRYLRGAEGSYVSEVGKEEIESATKGLLGSWGLKQDTMLHRNIDGKFFSQEIPPPLTTDALGKFIGTSITDKGFMSTTIQKGAFNPNSPVQLDILAPAGTKGIYVEEFTKNHGEYEFLMPPGTSLTIISVEKRGNIVHVTASVGGAAMPADTND